MLLIVSQLARISPEHYGPIQDADIFPQACVPLRTAPSDPNQSGGGDFMGLTHDGAPDQQLLRKG